MGITDFGRQWVMRRIEQIPDLDVLKRKINDGFSDSVLADEQVQQAIARKRVSLMKEAVRRK